VVPIVEGAFGLDSASPVLGNSCTEAVGVLVGLESKLNGHFPCANNKEVDNRLKIKADFFMAN
jgi:hypothetical protein